MTSNDRNSAHERFYGPLGGLSVDERGRIIQAIPGRTLEWTREYVAAMSRGDSNEMQRLTSQPTTPDSIDSASKPDTPTV